MAADFVSAERWHGTACANLLKSTSIPECLHPPFPHLFQMLNAHRTDCYELINDAVIVTNRHSAVLEPPTQFVSYYWAAECHVNIPPSKYALTTRGFNASFNCKLCSTSHTVLCTSAIPFNDVRMGPQHGWHVSCSISMMPPPFLLPTAWSNLPAKTAFVPSFTSLA